MTYGAIAKGVQPTVEPPPGGRRSLGRQGSMQNGKRSDLPFVGVLMLDTRFPRPLGDVGNAQTFERLGIPVRYLTVPGADPQKVVRDTDTLQMHAFTEAAQALVKLGASLVTTSCGFLARYQRELQAAIPVPVISSSLLWLASPLLAGERLAVLTFDAQALGESHFRGVGADPRTPTGGVAAGCEFQRRILGNEPTMDVALAQRNVVDAAVDLVAHHPDTTTLVLECTNMPPYADAIRAATGRRVEHLISLIQHHWKP